MQSKVKFLILFIVIFYTRKHITPMELGDSCVDENNVNGTCQMIYLCPQAILQKNFGGNYTICGYFRQLEVVCCADCCVNDISGISSKKYVQQCEQYKYTFGTNLSWACALFEQVRTAPSYISGGENAFPGEFPHMALIGCEGKNGTFNWGCGGTLISSIYILTAAHCFEPTSLFPTQLDVVRLGDLNIESDGDDAEPKNYKVAQVIKHPNYNRTMKYNDIALIRLETEVDFNFFVRPACLPYRDYEDFDSNNPKDSKLIITGWGNTQEAGKSAKHLQRAIIKQFTHQECNDIYTEDYDANLPTGISKKMQICAGSFFDNRDTCYGDSGGPMQTIHPLDPCTNTYEIIGVTSFGQGCATPGIPGVYTRVYYYNDWIESVVWN